MKLRLLLISILISTATIKQSYAWGPEGHAIVGRIAMRYVNDDVRKNILLLLGDMSIDTAANWMDIMKSNSDYDFMRSWHYLDFEKGKAYQESNKDNIINRLLITYNELLHKQTLCTEQIRTDLLILLHLMGDLHMPLHTGYEDDLGGNKITVQYDTLKTHNLHRFWDEDIIRLTTITDDDCLKHFIPSSTAETDIDFLAWMEDSRTLLDGVYDFPGFELSDAYLQKNKVVVEKQLLKAGLRLALLLNQLFYSAAPVLDYTTIAGKYKNGIDIKDVADLTGKKVTVCAAVTNISHNATITRISLAERASNSPLTIIVFARDYKKFPYPLEEMLKGKNVCIKGTIEQYRGKPQIVVSDPEDIIFL